MHYHSMSQRKLPYFTVFGGPFAAAQTMGVQITDDDGFTLAVSCSTAFAEQACAADAVRQVLDKHAVVLQIANPDAALSGEARAEIVAVFRRFGVAISGENAP